MLKTTLSNCGGRVLFFKPYLKKIPPNFAVPVDGRVHATEPLAEFIFPMKYHILLNPSLCGNRYWSL